MNHESQHPAQPGLTEGSPIEVVSRFDEHWASGFEVAELHADGCRVRRVADGAVLPVDFAYVDVRPDRIRRH